MKTETLSVEDLNQAWANTPGFRWMRGMLTDTGYRVIREPSEAACEPCPMGVAEDSGTDSTPWPLAANWLPDTSDAGTVGCLLELAEELTRCILDVCQGRYGGFVGYANHAKYGTLAEVNGPTRAHVLHRLVVSVRDNAL